MVMGMMMPVMMGGMVNPIVGIRRMVPMRMGNRRTIGMRTFHIAANSIGTPTMSYHSTAGSFLKGLTQSERNRYTIHPLR